MAYTLMYGVACTPNSNCFYHDISYAYTALLIFKLYIYMYHHGTDVCIVHACYIWEHIAAISYFSFELQHRGIIIFPGMYGDAWNTHMHTHYSCINLYNNIRVFIYISLFLSIYILVFGNKILYWRVYNIHALFTT